MYIGGGEGVGVGKGSWGGKGTAGKGGKWEGRNETHTRDSDPHASLEICAETVLSVDQFGPGPGSQITTYQH